MKNIFKYGLTIISAITFFSSCDSFLKETPTDLFGEEDAYANIGLIYTNTVANIYAQFGGEGDGASLVGVDRGMYDLNTFTTDENILPTRSSDWFDGGTWQKLYLHRWTLREEIFTNTWNYLYKVIGLCNNSIEILDYYSKEVPAWSEDLQSYKKEVRAIRAFYYFHLLDLFANVPIVVDSKTEMKDVEQASRSKVFEFVVSELEEVMGDLSIQRSNQPGTHYGRITQPVVWMIMAKLALNAEVYTDNDWTDNIRPNGQDIFFNVDGAELNAWETVIAYVDKLTAFGYILESDFSKNFSVNNESSSENILTLPMDPTLFKFKTYNLIRSLHYSHGNELGYSAWNGACATLTAVNKFGYCDIDGRLLPEENIDPRFEKTYFVKNNVVNAKGDNFITTDFGANKEGELDYGLAFQMQYLPHRVQLTFNDEYKNKRIVIEGFLDGKEVGGMVDEKLAGARMAKYEVDLAAQNAGEKPANDIVIYRYADALLMKAEAKIRLYGAGSGDNEVNEVRRRVNANSLSGVTLDELLDERTRELAWEGLRRQDQIRFGTFTASRPDRNPNTEQSLGAGQEFIPSLHRTVFPIDINILALNPKLNQNPGY